MFLSQVAWPIQYNGLSCHTLVLQYNWTLQQWARSCCSHYSVIFSPEVQTSMIQETSNRSFFFFFAKTQYMSRTSGMRGKKRQNLIWHGLLVGAMQRLGEKCCSQDIWGLGREGAKRERRVLGCNSQGNPMPSAKQHTETQWRDEKIAFLSKNSKCIVHIFHMAVTLYPRHSSHWEDVCIQLYLQDGGFILGLHDPRQYLL